MNRRLLIVLAAVVVLVAGGTVLAIAANQPESMPASQTETAVPGETESPSAEPDAAVEVESDAPAPGAYVEYSAEALAAAEGTRVLFFHAPWCPQCRALEADILAGAIPDGLTILKVDYDSSTGLRQQYGVTLQTTVVYVGADGEELSKEVLYDDTTLAALVAAAP